MIGIFHCHVTQKKCRKLGITETEIRIFYIVCNFYYFLTETKKFVLCLSAVLYDISVLALDAYNKA